MSCLFALLDAPNNYSRFTLFLISAADRMEVYSNKQLTHETIRVLTAIADPFWCLRAH